MGGRKSVELSHINYTEILKQCLAAVSHEQRYQAFRIISYCSLQCFQGYEYFGYDPATYFSSEADENSFTPEGGYLAEDGQARGEQPVLEIDLEPGGVKGSEHSQILCK